MISTMPINKLAVARRLTLFSLLWLLLAAGDMSSLLLGVIVVPFAVWLSLLLFRSKAEAAQPVNSAAGQLSLVRLALFIPTFLINSVKSGARVARLALSASKLSPGKVRYEVNLQSSTARIWLVHLISLLPGSLSVSLEDDYLEVHMLEVNDDNIADLRLCEQQVAHLFKLDLPQQ